MEVTRAGRLLATVLGQDLEESADGVFRVASDRVISTVDPQAWHGRKSSAHGFDGYKAHVGIDPDSEIIIVTTVTAGNVGDAGAAVVLLTDDLPATDLTSAEDLPAAGPGGELDRAGPLAVYGDSASGTGQLLESWRPPERRSAARSSRRWRRPGASPRTSSIDLPASTGRSSDSGRR